ncbi:hypothetical protein D3875_15290 [Deinococcus cavernae]|uniref:Uncharacterized protein n=1 Tax=Deinococcus cavernae TaxID=2320857 RepID=A0A418V9E0_9DEIO|nr:glycerol-3-phosphate acyltransferase [Deinococcus cavernae]RJF72700.1 hypothetical protein D3875_15290 [Deinococcus cavernae]
MPAAIFVVSYLLGSVVMGILYSRARGDDIRSRDLPGGSGTFRQYGRQAAVMVSVLDILKGVVATLLARWLAQGLAPEWTWLAVLGVVLGHCYPVFFRFKGGGGIAPFVGALLPVAPLTILGTIGLALALVPVYKATLQKALKLNAIPFVTAVSLPVGWWLSTRFGGSWEFLAGSAVMLVRAVHLLVRPEGDGAGKA